MKKFILPVLIALFLDASGQTCPIPMAANVFKQKMNQLALQPNDQQKLQLAKNMLQGSCLLSTQVKDLASVFAGDYYRFEFCKRAWKHTFDPGNFFDVYDAFASFSSALRLYDFVTNTNPAPSPGPPPGPGPGTPQAWYPNLPYPSPSGYKGITGCPLPMADNDFEFLSKKTVNQTNDGNRRIEALKLTGSNCLSVSQAMKLATLFDLESNRLSFMKEVFVKLYDLENYSYATEIFSNTPYKNDWLAFCPTAIDPVTVPPAPPAPVCEVTPQEYEEAKRSISNVSINSTKLTLAKQIISTKKCFTVKQLAGIIELFSVESSRLEVALYSYDYCINKSDYYQLTESFSTTGSKNKLLDFISTK